MESFIQQLKTATDQLSATDRKELNDALAFLTFAAGDDVRQRDPAKFAKWGDSDVLAHSMVKLYDYARDQGDQMTLRKYVILADESRSRSQTCSSDIQPQRRQPSNVQPFQASEARNLGL
jgi:hypothetical protein